MNETLTSLFSPFHPQNIFHRPISFELFQQQQQQQQQQQPFLLLSTPLLTHPHPSNTSLPRNYAVPSQPEQLQGQAISATSIQLRWQRPADKAGPNNAETIIKYELYWNR